MIRETKDAEYFDGKEIPEKDPTQWSNFVEMNENQLRLACYKLLLRVKLLEESHKNHKVPYELKFLQG